MAGFDDLAAEYLREHCEEHPVAATFLGIDGYDDRLDDLSAAAIERRERRADEWLERLDGLDDGEHGELSDDERIDRDLLRSFLRGGQIVRDWAAWRRTPDPYLGTALNGVFGLFLHRLHDDEALVRFASARLAEVPGLLAEARRNLDPSLANPVLVRRSLGQCRAGATYTRELLPAEVADDGLRGRLAEAGAGAAAAFEELGGFLEDLAERAEGDYALGGDRYTRLLQERELLDLDVDRLRERGREEWDRLDGEMRTLAGEVSGREDWRAVVEELNDHHPPTPEAMREGYERSTERARAFLAEHDLVTFPEGERCLVEPSPPFQRPVLAVASYFRPPAFRSSLTGRFMVPFPPDGTPAEEVQQRLKTNGYHSMPTIAVHEAYPGHHWHLVRMQVTARDLRKLHSSAYFTEGWALYTEAMMRSQGFFEDPRDELCHLDARIFRAARIVVDTSLHTGEMSFDEAVEHMTTKASLTEPTARAEVARYCAWPTQAASYLTGCLEIERLQREWEAGGGGLKEFHDRLAGSGAMPVPLAERALRT